MVSKVARSRSSPPARRLAAPARRALIEDAAARLFARCGYEGATMEQIAREAGVSKPMLYRHFESKKELCMRLLERRREELAAAPLDEFIRGHERERGASLAAMIEAWFAHVQAHPHSARLLFQDALGDPDIRALQQELRSRQRAADVALLRELGAQVPAEQLEPLGEIIRSSLTGLALWWLDNPHVSRSAVCGAVLRMTRGLFGQRGSAAHRSL